jgi:hypothetical protein
MITMTRTAMALCTLGLLLAPLGPSARADDDDCDGGGDDDEQKITQFLDNTGEDPDGTCEVRFIKDGDDLKLMVFLKHMDIGDYELWVDGNVVGSIHVNPSGSGHVQFHSHDGDDDDDGDCDCDGDDDDDDDDGEEDPGGKGPGNLDFAFAGKLFEIKQGDTVFFSDIFVSGQAGKHRFHVFMVNVGPDPNAAGELHYVSTSDGKKFEVKVRGLDEGTYDLIVGGETVAQLEVTDDDEIFVFADPAGADQSLLDFDPLGKQIDIALGGTVYLTAMMPGAGSDSRFEHARKCANNLGKGHGDRLRVLLAGTGSMPAARGNATLTLSDEPELRVEFKHVIPGSYTLRVGGEQVGSTTVDGSKGEFRFSASPGPGEGLLDFAVQGERIELRQGTQTVLAVIFPISAQAAKGAWKKEKHDADRVRINLVPAGADLDVCGVLDWKDKASHDTLKISVCDLPAGSYDLLVGGKAVPGVLIVVKPDGKAGVVFDSKAKGKKQPLDFAVPGKTVQVTPAGEPGTVLMEGVVK